MSQFKKAIWKRIKDGERDWKVPQSTSEACDLFEIEIVQPLRDLRDEGRVAIKEVEAPCPGRYRVCFVQLVGEPNLDL